MTVDAHQHFWQYNPTDFGWMTDEMASLRKDFLPADLEALMPRADMDRTIAVQARSTAEETRFLLDLAAGNSFIGGVVGWIDLTADDLAAQLEALSGESKLVGLRHPLHDEEDDDFILRPDFLRGLATLDEYGLVYDLLVRPQHLSAVTEVVEMLPDQPFVIDHIAKPAIESGYTEPWLTHMKDLASFHNVSCKVSGLVTEAEWKRWSHDDFRPYLAAVLEAFGADRLMFGSDWPVCTLSATYEETFLIVDDFIAELSDDEIDGILGDNAERIYGLPE